jgi:steroid delta-isomerase-like uncharacterized protein
MLKRVLSLAMAVVAITVVTAGVHAQQPGYRDKVIKFFDEVWNKGNLAYIDEAVTSDFVRFGHTVQGTVTGPAAYKEFVRATRASFTDYNITLVEQMGVGNKSTVTWRLRGNYVGPDQKVSPGRTIDLPGKSIWFMRGDKIAKEVVEIDDGEYYRQIQMALPYSELDNRALLLGFLYTVYQDGNISSLPELVADKHVLHDAGGHEVVGCKAYQDRLQAMRDAFPDLAITAYDVVADGNLVTARWTITGTHRGEWEGIAPTQKKIAAAGISMVRIQNDKIQETWTMVDDLLIRQQLTGK